MSLLCLGSSDLSPLAESCGKRGEEETQKPRKRRKTQRRRKTRELTHTHRPHDARCSAWPRITKRLFSVIARCARWREERRRRGMETARPRGGKKMRVLSKREGEKASLKGALSRFRECATHDCLKIHSFIRRVGSPVRPPPFSPWQHVGSKEVVSFTRTNAHGRMLAPVRARTEGILHGYTAN